MSAYIICLKKCKQIELIIKISGHYWVCWNVSEDGAAMQSALKEWTGQRTVPNVFISGKQIGGCDGKFFSSILYK